MCHEVTASERDDGLGRVLHLVREYTGDGGSPWEPSGQGADLEPLRLLVSTRLSLVAVVDHGRLRKRVRERLPEADERDVITELDQVARQLRFAILDADTAQVLVLIVIVHNEKDLKAVASDVFGPGGSKGDVVVRVVYAADEAALGLDLEIVRPSLTTAAQSVGARPAAAFAGHAAAVLEAAIGKEAEEARGWAQGPLKLVEDAFRSPEAETAPGEAASRLEADLLRVLGELALRAPEREGRESQ